MIVILSLHFAQDNWAAMICTKLFLELMINIKIKMQPNFIIFGWRAHKSLATIAPGAIEGIAQGAC